ncbi:hypothetical protein [Rhizobium mongolense]|uniref:Adenylosuccinate lyase n=1 Tax=Rhizobium mongolense TaxID=57676 RepID=A0A7W6RJF9_9HYPH|nr:hypothetical protein [Rhizobium mongolense]MBB4273628.1 adenylosuccinate lyase [Rhizobium mongolense]
MMQLSPLMGRHKAHHLLYEAAQRTATEGTAFLQTLSDAVKSAGVSDIALDLIPENYLGEIDEIIEDLGKPKNR